MKRYILGEVGRRQITAFESRDASISLIVAALSGLQVALIHIEPNGVVGAHEAAVDQLFIVVEGHGQVMSDGSQPEVVESGVAVFWQRGEVHETRAAATGLKAIVIEGEQLAEHLSL